jgi:hypothetical protein
MAASLKHLAFGILFFCWLVTLFMSQASSTDYRVLFWSVLPFATTHLALVVLIFVQNHDWKRWLLACFSAPALLSFLEMTCRVWFHVRLF